MFSKKFLLTQVLFLVAAMALLVLYLRQQPPRQMDVLGQVGNFHLTNSNGQTVTLKDLRGKVWVADFFFTTCGSTCPMLSAHMGRLQKLFKPYSDVRLVSFTVNPENDNPQILKVYAQKFHADPNRWIFLTGSREELTKVVVGSFKLGDIRNPIFHSSYFVLVDRKGRIRGYYDGTEGKIIEKIAADLKRL